MLVAIIDYGMGNIHSIQSALKFLGIDSIYTNNKHEIENSSHVILPGVGSFHKAMMEIKKSLNKSSKLIPMQ